MHFVGLFFVFKLWTVQGLYINDFQSAYINVFIPHVTWLVKSLKYHFKYEIWAECLQNLQAHEALINDLRKIFLRRETGQSDTISFVKDLSFCICTSPDARDPTGS